MQSDYYEPYPLMRLSRSLVLAGQIGSGTSAIARNIASRTGLPFFEIDRLIEHEAGRSLARIAEEEGLLRIERWAQNVLDRLLGQPRNGLIALDRAWLPRGAGSVLRLRTDFVHIKRPTSVLLERISRERHRGGDWLLEGVGWPIREESELKPLLDRREGLLAQAKILLDAGEQHENELASVLLDSLGSLTGAQRI